MSAIFPILPTSLGIYNLTRFLGAHELTELYLAQQSYVERAVVMEVLRPEAGPAEVAAFLESARCRASVTLPHVCPVLEASQEAGLRFLIQELPPGHPLAQFLAEQGKLSSQQAYELIQAVADLYCACREQGLAARPPAPETVYWDADGSVSFFSPVVAGEPTEELRAAQMAALADMLERAMDPGELAVSNIAVIIHWLRTGYGGAPLQWRPLAASLQTLRRRRARGGQGPAAWWQRVRAALSSRRTLRQVLRPALRVVGLLAVCAAVVAGVSEIGARYDYGAAPELPAVDARWVHCRLPGGELGRVAVRPVSIEEYEAFLTAWGKMSAAERAALHRDMPAEAALNHTPADWAAQLAAAQAGRAWNGELLCPEAPVRGVSYWDALAYARYVGGLLPTAAMLRTARRNAPDPEYVVGEWTGTSREAPFPYEPYRIVYPATGEEWYCSPRAESRILKRGFRLYFPE